MYRNVSDKFFKHDDFWFRFNSLVRIDAFCRDFWEVSRPWMLEFYNRTLLQDGGQPNIEPRTVSREGTWRRPRRTKMLSVMQAQRKDVKTPKDGDSNHFRKRIRRSHQTVTVIERLNRAKFYFWTLMYSALTFINVSLQRHSKTCLKLFNFSVNLVYLMFFKVF